MIRIGSRGSALARWQSEHVSAQLRAQHPQLDVQIDIVPTTGDRITDVPLSKIGDKGLFTKELDRAVLDGRVHIAVHSLKDVPTRLQPGLVIAAVGEREDSHDALVVADKRAGTLARLRAGARVGTSSLRRRAQLLALRPDLQVVDLRGNLDTRLSLVQRGEYDAAIVALAGVKRLGRAAEVAEILEAPQWLPAVGQGALCIVCRSDDVATQRLVQVFDHPPTRTATDAERALLRELEGGCQIPIGALAQVAGRQLQLRALVASTDGRRLVRDQADGAAADAISLGQELARKLLAAGARRILEELRAAQSDTAPAPAAP